MGVLVRSDVVGDGVGLVEGDGVGLVEGEGVGTSVGEEVGRFVGEGVGTFVGDVEGEGVGRYVGDGVGDNDGEVGAIDGENVVGEEVGELVGEVVRDFDGILVFFDFVGFFVFALGREVMGDRLGFEVELSEVVVMLIVGLEVLRVGFPVFFGFIVGEGLGSVVGEGDGPVVGSVVSEVGERVGPEVGDRIETVGAKVVPPEVGTFVVRDADGATVGRPIITTRSTVTFFNFTDFVLSSFCNSLDL